MTSNFRSCLLLLFALLVVAGAACSSGKRPPPKSTWEVLAPFFQRKGETNAPTVEAVIADVLAPVRIGTSTSYFYRTESRWPTNGHELSDFLLRHPFLPPTNAAGFEAIFIPRATDLELIMLLQFTPRTDGGLDVTWPNQGTNISYGILRVSAPTNSVPKPHP